MKRSFVNSILREGDAFIRSFGYVMPPFAYWSVDEMKARDHTAIKARGMGWDITDYGQGKFDELGLFLFTTRNGLADDLTARRGMVYAEKIMISRKDQLSPMHRHIVKSEDIITVVVRNWCWNCSCGPRTAQSTATPTSWCLLTAK